MTLNFLNDVIIDAESTQKSKNYVIIVSLKSETMGKLINRMPGSRLYDINRWQASRWQQALSKPCLVNLISKDTHLVFSISGHSVRLGSGSKHTTAEAGARGSESCYNFY